MRHRFLLPALLLAAALAQSAPAALAQPEAPRPMSMGQTVLALYGGYAGGFVGAIAVGVAADRLGASSDAALVTGIVAYPLTTAAATYGIGRALGADGTFRGTLVGAAVGAGACAGLSLLVGTLIDRSADSAPPEDFADVFGLVLEGLGMMVVLAIPYALGPPIGAVVGFNVSVQPLAALTPDGTAAPGVALRAHF